MLFSFHGIISNCISQIRAQGVKILDFDNQKLQDRLEKLAQDTLTEPGKISEFVYLASKLKMDDPRLVLLVREVILKTWAHPSTPPSELCCFERQIECPPNILDLHEPLLQTADALYVNEHDRVDRDRVALLSEIALRMEQNPSIRKVYFDSSLALSRVDLNHLLITSRHFPPDVATFFNSGYLPKVKQDLTNLCEFLSEHRCQYLLDSVDRSLAAEISGYNLDHLTQEGLERLGWLFTLRFVLTRSQVLKALIAKTSQTIVSKYPEQTETFGDFLPQIQLSFIQQRLMPYVKGAVLSDQDVTDIGKLIWQNRYLLSTASDISIVINALKKKIESSDSNNKQGTLKFIERLLPPGKLPFDLFEVIIKKSLIGLHIDLETALDVCPHLPMETFNTLPFLVIRQFPSYENLILPNLEFLDFRIGQYTDDEINAICEKCPKLKHLHLPASFKPELSERLSATLETLTMGGTYNRPLPPHLTNLRSITMGDDYDRPLPPDLTNLRSITMGLGYRQSLPNTLTNLTSITMGVLYDQSLPPDLTNLRSITMGYGYRQSLPNTLTKLTSITMGPHYKHKLPEAFTHLTHVVVGDKYSHALPRTRNELTLYAHRNKKWRVYAHLPPSSLRE